MLFFPCTVCAIRNREGSFLLWPNHVLFVCSLCHVSDLHWMHVLNCSYHRCIALRCIHRRKATQSIQGIMDLCTVIRSVRQAPNFQNEWCNLRYCSKPSAFLCGERSELESSSAYTPSRERKINASYNRRATCQRIKHNRDPHWQSCGGHMLVRRKKQQIKHQPSKLNIED